MAEGPSDEAVLVMDDIPFKVSIAKMTAKPNTLLGRMFATRDNGMFRQNNAGQYVIEYSTKPSIFQAILDYYTTDVATCPLDCELETFLETCQYFMIPLSLSTISTRHVADFMHFLANEGARKNFEEHHFKQKILPLLEASAARGDRQTKIIFLLLDETLSAEEGQTYDEDYKYVIQNAELHRFMSFAENRELVTQSLQEKGFKKVRLGIERCCFTPRHQNALRYENRPYLMLSWEKEEKQNRHVDFQHISRNPRPNRARFSLRD